MTRLIRATVITLLAAIRDEADLARVDPSDRADIAISACDMIFGWVITALAEQGEDNLNPDDSGTEMGLNESPPDYVRDEIQYVEISGRRGYQLSDRAMEWLMTGDNCANRELNNLLFEQRERWAGR